MPVYAYKGVNQAGRSAKGTIAPRAPVRPALRCAARASLDGDRGIHRRVRSGRSEDGQGRRRGLQSPLPAPEPDPAARARDGDPSS